MRNDVKLFVVMLLALVLSGQSASALGWKAKPGVPTGTGPVGFAEAANMFEVVCVNNMPKFNRSARVLASLGFVFDDKTKLYIHPQKDVRFGVYLSGGDITCAMQIGTKDDGDPFMSVLTEGISAKLLGKANTFLSRAGKKSGRTRHRYTLDPL